MDIQTLQNQITGLESRKKELQDAEKIFIKAQGLHESAEKAGADHGKKEVKLQAIKEEIAELQAKKREALQPTAEALSAKMSEVMPEGKAILGISDDGVWIGWERSDGVRVPYAGLSSGQKVPFDAALAYALLGSSGNKVIIFETGECDPVHLQRLVNHLTANSLPNTQVIVNAYQMPATVPPGWEVSVIQ